MGTTEAIAGVKKAVETLAAAHSEAPVSMSAKIQSPTGVIWTLTIRDGATAEMVSELVQLTKSVEAGMVKAGWKPYGNGLANSHVAAPVAAPPPALSGAPAITGQNGTPANGKGKKSPGRDFILAPDGTPYCAIHGQPLQPSNYGGFYCPLPGEGRNGYCTARYTP